MEKVPQPGPSMLKFQDLLMNCFQHLIPPKGCFLILSGMPAEKGTSCGDQPQIKLNNQNWP